GGGGGEAETRSYPLLCVRDTREGLWNLARGYRETLTARMIAVTGSVGKTTVKEMLADVLSEQGGCARTCGNWNNDIGLPLSLLAMSPDAAYGVFELGMNHPGELAPLCALLAPGDAIVTGVGPVHIEFFASVKDIAIEKASVLRALPHDGMAVLDADGEWFELLRGYAPCRVVTVSARPDAAADYLLAEARPHEAWAVVLERATGERVDIRLRVPGMFALRDALLVVALSRSLGVPFTAIRSALAGFEPVGMRWKTCEMQGVTVINDAYNANPLSMQAALQTAADLPAVGAKWLVLGDMLEMGAHAEEAHLVIGRRVADGPWAGLVTVGPLGEVIARGARENGFAREQIFCCETAMDAGQVLQAGTKPGDMVLLKASRSVRLEDALAGWRKHEH
ncbi:MAG: UDP-N-acetylmuramoyl-tripeptide--D-alanyl-D-alanine ligase, partial [Spartobacteria bacterium]|nr:UDP-N-acetylmuramoyl-tripeptide--D-alanyl-D-alanine ligase [Spartobacteria bacterium]